MVSRKRLRSSVAATALSAAFTLALTSPGSDPQPAPAAFDWFDYEKHE